MKSKFVVTASWNDVPHLSDAVKTELLASIRPDQRDARSRGIPQLGEGAVYPVAIEDVSIPDFQIPPSYRVCYGLDVGWNATAAVWGAWNDETDTIYLWAAYKRGQAEPSIHASAIQLRGKWIPGVCDPAAETSSQADGRKLIDQYRALDLDLRKADNAVDSGIFEVWNRLATGRLKVFKSLSEWFAEYSLYRRNKGVIVKENDHLMDATRYLLMSGGPRAIKRPVVQPLSQQVVYDTIVPSAGDLAWMAR